MDWGARPAKARPQRPAPQRADRQPAAPHFQGKARSHLARPGARAAGPAIQRAAAARTAFPACWPVPGWSRARASMRPRAVRPARAPPRARAATCLPAAPRQRSSAAAPNPRSTGPIPWWAPRWARARGPGWTSPAVARRRRSRLLRGPAAATLTAPIPAEPRRMAIRTALPPTASPRMAATIQAAARQGPRAARPSLRKHPAAAPRTAVPLD